ncbi:MFS transporter [Cohnella hongkongensis]|uniref:MFS transporter n=1 Tax=Cohnella hongkongensis TaxID=178337 RepID=A0ABV9F9E3_9BACL
MDTRRHRPYGRLDNQTLLLLAVNGLFALATALSGTYFGVYIWKASNDYFKLGWFTLLTHLCMGLTFWIAGNAAKEGNKMAIMRVGVGFSALFYALVLLLKGSAVHYIWLLGLVQGLATGLFWLAYNVVYFEATEPDNRDKFNGWAGTTGSLIGIVVPWTSGWLISRLGGEAGYRAIFIASACVFVAAIVTSFFIRNRRTSGSYTWRWPYRLMRESDSDWPSVMGALAAQGVRESVFGVIIGILIYVQTGSEMKLGNFMLLTSAVGFASFLCTGKWLKPKWRYRAMQVGAIALIAVILPMFAGFSYATLLAFGLGAALFFPLYIMPMTAVVFDLIGRNEESAGRRVEYVVARELALNVGRIAGMAIFMGVISVSKTPQAMKWLLLAVGSSPLLSWLFMRKVFATEDEPDETVDMEPKGVL